MKVSVTLNNIFILRDGWKGDFGYQASFGTRESRGHGAIARTEARERVCGMCVWLVSVQRISIRSRQKC